MSQNRSKIAAIAGVSFGLVSANLHATDAPATPAAATPTDIVTVLTGDPSKQLSWTGLLTDDSAGSISAAGLLGISGDSISNVENIRDVVTSFKGLTSGNEKATLGVSITPARTSILPMNLATYSEHSLARPIANFTLGYAQGDATISASDFQRQAVSAETSVFLNRKDDPLLALWDAWADTSNDCHNKVLTPTPPETPPTPGAPPPVGGAKPAEAPKTEADEIKAKATACREAVNSKLRWNASRFSLSYATGQIKPKHSDGGDKSLGGTVATALSYGFDGIGEPTSWLRQHAQLSAIYRASWDEPLLESLVTAPIVRKDTSLVSGRLLVGSSRMRFLAEFSNARSSQITASQRAFKQAVGFDVKVYSGLWANLRYGVQRTIDGTKNETGSILNLSYSPSALLPQ